MAKKFQKHTGIESRAIALEDEVSLAQRVIERLVEEHPSSIDLSHCAAMVFASPSVIPASVAQKYMDRQSARGEQPTRMAHRLCQAMGLSPQRVVGTNGFCSGYAKAMQLSRRLLQGRLRLAPHEFVLVVTSSRISRITDFEDRQSGALFGDFATATVLSRVDSPLLPVHLELLDAHYEKQAVSRSYFDFRTQGDVLVPGPEGGKLREASRIVFSLDGMGIADTAPRAMASAARQMADEHHLAPGEIQHIVPHQAGKAIVRLTGMKLEEAGFSAEPVNGLTRSTGNVSSGSVPFALKENWHSLSGNILCPVAAVGAPGKAEVSQGCLLLRRLGQASGAEKTKAA